VTENVKMWGVDPDGTPALEEVWIKVTLDDPAEVVGQTKDWHSKPPKTMSTWRGRDKYKRSMWCRRCGNDNGFTIVKWHDEFYLIENIELTDDEDEE